ncbi:hypothetical protein D3C79_1077150 [compost metagenome]
MGWSSALFYYGDDALNQYRFARVDLRVAKRLRWERTSLELAGMLQQRLDDEPTTIYDNRYDSRQVLSFSAQLEF